MILIDHQPINLNKDEVFGWFPVPDDVTRYIIRLARCTSNTPNLWKNTDTIIGVEINLSQDGGASWRSIGGAAGGHGGIVIGLNGQEHIENVFDRSLEAAPNRSVQALVNVTRGPLVSRLTVEAF